jgi:hypothetical protein
MAKKKEKQQQQQQKDQVTMQGSATISLGSKAISISNDPEPILTITNEYGNSATYPINLNSFESIWTQIWQFVKDSQH